MLPFPWINTWKLEWLGHTVGVCLTSLETARMFYKNFFYHFTFLTVADKSFPSFKASPKCSVINHVCTYVCKCTCLCIVCGRQRLSLAVTHHFIYFFFWRQGLSLNLRITLFLLQSKPHHICVYMGKLKYIQNLIWDIHWGLRTYHPQINWILYCTFKYLGISKYSALALWFSFIVVTDAL